MKIYIKSLFVSFEGEFCAKDCMYIIDSRYDCSLPPNAYFGFSCKKFNTRLNNKESKKQFYETSSFIETYPSMPLRCNKCIDEYKKGGENEQISSR